MGQRSQILIRTPKEYWNPKNPNNKPPSWYIYHNQWLYGWSFIDYLRNMLQSIEKCINHKKEHPQLKQYPISFERDVLEPSIKHCNHKNLLDQKRTYRYFSDETESDIKYMKQNTWKEIFKGLDNNNGFMIIYINNDNSITWDIISGVEDTETNKRVTPKEYFNLFYKDETLSSKDKQELKECITEIEKYKRINYTKVLK